MGDPYKMLVGYGLIQRRCFDTAVKSLNEGCSFASIYVELHSDLFRLGAESPDPVELRNWLLRKKTKSFVEPEFEIGSKSVFSREAQDRMFAVLQTDVILQLERLIIKVIEAGEAQPNEMRS